MRYYTRTLLFIFVFSAESLWAQKVSSSFSIFDSTYVEVRMVDSYLFVQTTPFRIPKRLVHLDSIQVGFGTNFFQYATESHRFGELEIEIDSSTKYIFFETSKVSSFNSDFEKFRNIFLRGKWQSFGLMVSEPFNQIMINNSNITDKNGVGFIQSMQYDGNITHPKKKKSFSGNVDLYEFEIFYNYIHSKPNRKRHLFVPGWVQFDRKRYLMSALYVGALSYSINNIVKQYNTYNDKLDAYERAYEIYSTSREPSVVVFQKEKLPGLRDKVDAARTTVLLSYLPVVGLYLVNYLDWMFLIPEPITIKNSFDPFGNNVVEFGISYPLD